MLTFSQRKKNDITNFKSQIPHQKLLQQLHALKQERTREMSVVRLGALLFLIPKLTDKISFPKNNSHSIGILCHL